MKNLLSLSFGLMIIAAPAARAVAIVNGDFSTGNFAGWTLSYNDPYTDVQPWTIGYLGVSGNPGTAYYVDLTGPDGTPLTLSQSFTTIPGDYYTFSFELSHTNYSGDAGASFTASFGSDTVLSLVGGQESSILGQWQQESFIVEATAPVTTIAFTDNSVAGYYLLADIDPAPTPDQGLGLTLTAAVLLGLCAFSARNFRRRLI